jgi:hypothetical protein
LSERGHGEPGAGLRDAVRLAQRLDEVLGVEEGVEAGDQVEGVVGPRATAEAEVALGRVPARDRDERQGDVDPRPSRAAIGGQADEAAASSSGVTAAASPSRRKIQRCPTRLAGRSPRRASRCTLERGMPSNSATSLPERMSVGVSERPVGRAICPREALCR